MTNGDIDSVLNASNYYEVLGIQPDDALDEKKLRKAYLRRSVEVHPDKNSDNPKATIAFQRVTQAYTILSDEQSRTQYEACGEECSNHDSKETYYAGNSSCPSFQEAMFIFASVASMVAAARGGGGGGGGGAAAAAGSGSGSRVGSAVDVAKALLFAEQFLNRDKGSSIDGTSKAHAAMGAAASLRVVGSAVRAAGFKKVAAALDSSASFVEVAGIGAMIADIPEVQKMARQFIDAGNEKVAASRREHRG